MIKQKLVSFAAASLLSVGLLGSIASRPATAQTKADASIIIQFCKDAHREFMKGDKGAYLHQGMSGVAASNRPVVALACAAYGEGFDQGRNGGIRYA